MGHGYFLGNGVSFKDCSLGSTLCLLVVVLQRQDEETVWIAVHQAGVALIMQIAVLLYKVVVQPIQRVALGFDLFGRCAALLHFL